MSEVFRFPETQYSRRHRFAAESLRLFGSQSPLEIAAQTPYSLVFKSEAPSIGFASVYFKFNPSDSANEAAVLTLLAEAAPGLAPRLLGSWPEESALATEGCGQCAIGLPDAPALDAMEAALRALGRAQTAFSESMLSLRSELCGEAGSASGARAPASRGARLLSAVQETLATRSLPRRVRAMATDGGILEADGMPPAERERLLLALEKAEDMAFELSCLPVAPSLEHGDFHDGNVVVGHRGDAKVIDWAESRLAHPFFSFESVASRLARRRGVARDSEPALRLLAAHNEAWRERVDEASLIEARRLSRQLYPLYLAISRASLLRLPGAKQWMPQGRLSGELAQFSAEILPATKPRLRPVP
jgi:hypothetical protein